VSIDTEGWLEAVLGLPIYVDDDRCGLSEAEAQVADDGWDNGPLARYAAENLLSAELNTSVQCIEAVRDNVYNAENQFSQQFTFTVYTPTDSPDWTYSECVVAVCLHRGGDVRGNYGKVALYHCDSLADAGFFDWVVGWHIVDEDSPLRDKFATDHWEVGYSQQPTCELEKELLEYKKLTWKDDLGEWTESGTYKIEVDGAVLEVYPNMNV
jgi:hypothetical protein